MEAVKGTPWPDRELDFIRYSADSMSLDKLQREGTAAIWNILEGNGLYAYLADEVGMGKTFQALGIISALFRHVNRETRSSGRVEIPRIAVICPGWQMQRQWIADFHTFVRACYLAGKEGVVGDDLLKDSWKGQATVSPEMFERLPAWGEAMLLDSCRLSVLRYPSFSRPLSFNGADDTFEKMWARYRSALAQIGSGDYGDRADLEAGYKGVLDDDRRRELSITLNDLFAERLGHLIAHHREFDLVIFDEAQYLRHTSNRRNTIIRKVFNGNVHRYLFLSATPLHSRFTDLDSLDAYLKDRGGEARSTIARDRVEKGLLKCMQSFMVRRVRRYTSSRTRRCYSKSEYRLYARNPVRGRENPYYALSLALVQKHLVRLLAGGNNRFRIGECSSFESLRASSGLRELEQSAEKARARDPDADSAEKTLDRDTINKLNRSYQKRFGSSAVLPHAKVDTIVDELAQRHLAPGTSEKALVFVRRLATVTELLAGLQARQQHYIDERIDAWRNVDGMDIPADYWDDSGTEEPDEGEQETDEVEEDSGVVQRSEKLPYFDALRQKAGNGGRRGMLRRFRNLLQRHNAERKSPLGFLLERGRGMEDESWLSFVRALGCDRADFDTTQPARIDCMKRALFQAMRQSEFIVDLHILYYYMKEGTLSSKLNACLDGTLVQGNAVLREHFESRRGRLRDWIEYFDVIVDRCFKDEKHQLWKDIYGDGGERSRIDNVFVGATEVLGRSGEMQNRNAVAQFKFPTSPNILVCTDVLKEGINLHLFCSRVYHYGVAWTSGDLEQRIGRVDRFKGLTERRILDSDAVAPPRLEVGFPYLEGSLDEAQVRHVWREKLRNDAVMDLGVSQRDVIEWDPESGAEDDVQRPPSETWNDGALEGRAFLEKEAKIFVLEPSELEHLRRRHDRVMRAQKIIAACIMRAWNGLEEKEYAEGCREWSGEGMDISLKYHGRPGCFIIEEQREAGRFPGFRWNARVTRTGQGRKKTYRTTRTLIIPFVRARESTGSSERFESRAQGFLEAFRRHDGNPRRFQPVPPHPWCSGVFEYDHQAGCLNRRIEAKDPLDPDNKACRKQDVRLDSLEGLPVMRSFVCAPGGNVSEHGLRERTLAADADYSIGHFFSDDYGMWLCIPLYAPENLSGFIVEWLCRYAASTADRLEQLITGKDSEPSQGPSYQVHTTLLFEMARLFGGIPVEELNRAESLTGRTLRWSVPARDEQPRPCLAVLPRECGVMERSVHIWESVLRDGAQPGISGKA